MNALIARFPALAGLRVVSASSLAIPLLIIGILAMMILPLPPFLLDIFFTFNIALSMVVLLVAAGTREPLEFSAFPTIWWSDPEKAARAGARP